MTKGRFTEQWAIIGPIYVPCSFSEYRMVLNGIRIVIVGTSFPRRMKLETFCPHLVSLASHNPYAPNTPPINDIAVVMIAIMNEFLKYSPKSLFSKTLLKCLNVGSKMNFGGIAFISREGLNELLTISRIGAMNQIRTAKIKTIMRILTQSFSFFWNSILFISFREA